MAFDFNAFYESLPDIKPYISMYVGNLKQGKFIHPLDNFQFFIKDCDKSGKVMKKNIDVLVQFYPVRTDAGLDHLLLCCQDAKSEVYQSSLPKNKSITFTTPIHILIWSELTTLKGIPKG